MCRVLLAISIFLNAQLKWSIELRRDLVKGLIDILVSISTYVDVMLQFCNALCASTCTKGLHKA